MVANAVYLPPGNEQKTRSYNGPVLFDVLDHTKKEGPTQKQKPKHKQKQKCTSYTRYDENSKRASPSMSTYDEGGIYTRLRTPKVNRPLSDACMVSYNSLLDNTLHIGTIQESTSRTDLMKKFRLLMKDPVMQAFDSTTAESIHKHLSSFLETE